MTAVIDKLEQKRKERAEQLEGMAQSLGFSKPEESKESKDVSMITNTNLKEATFNFLKGKLICQPNLPTGAIEMTLSGFLDADSKIQNCYSMMALNFISDDKRESLTGKLWSRDVGHYYMHYYAFKTLHLVNNATFKNLNDNFFLPISRQESDYTDQNILLPAGILIMYSKFCILQKFFDSAKENDKQVAITSFKLIAEKISKIEDELISALSALVDSSFSFLEDRENEDLKNSIIDDISKAKEIYTDYLKKHSDDKCVITDQMSEIDSLANFVKTGR